MAILRKQQRTTYTVIDNEAVRNTDLSWRATGLLVYLLSLPDDWSVNVTDLSRRKTDGKTATRSTMQELEDAGYLTIEIEFDGTLRRHIWIVSEEPQPVTKAPEVADGTAPDGPTPDGPPPDALALLSTKEEVTSNEVTISEVAPAARNLYWDATVILFGEPSNGQRSLYGRFVAMVKDGGFQPSDIPDRAARLAATWGPDKVTVASLEKHWTRFDGAISNVTDSDIEAYERNQRGEAMIARLSDDTD